MRRRWGLFLIGLLGARCVVTGERIYPRDRPAHERDEHATEGSCQ